MWQLVSQRQATMGLMLAQQACGPTCSVPDTGVAMYADGPKWGNGDPLSGMDRSPDIIQAELPGLCRARAWGGSDPLLHFPISLWVCVGQLKWPRHQSEHVFRSQLPSLVLPLSSFPLPYLWFWTQPQLGPSWSRLWLVWPATRCPHYNLLYLGSVDKFYISQVLEGRVSGTH